MTQKEIKLFINFVYDFNVNKFEEAIFISKEEHQAMQNIARWLYKNKAKISDKELEEASKKHPLLEKFNVKEL